MALTDPVMVWVTDPTRTRLGRRKRWIFVGFVPRKAPAWSSPAAVLFVILQAHCAGAGGSSHRGPRSFPGPPFHSPSLAR